MRTYTQHIPRNPVRVDARDFDNLTEVARVFDLKPAELRKRVRQTGDVEVALGLRTPSGTDTTDPVYAARRVAGFTDAEARAFPPYVKTRRPVRLYGVTFPDAESVLNATDDATRAVVTALIRRKDYDPPGYAHAVVYHLYNWCAAPLAYDER